MICRVLFSESSPNLGGQELQLLELAGGLAARGIEAFLLCRPGSRIAEVARQRGLPLDYVPYRNSAHPPSVTRVRAALLRLRPDALVCHSGHDANVGAIAARLAGAARPRLIRFRTYQHGLPHAWTYNRLFDLTLVPSEEMRRGLLANPRVLPERIAVLRPGVPFDRLDARAAEPLDADLVQRLAAMPPQRIVHAAMLRHEKGHLLMLDLLAGLVAHFPQLCYVIAGEGELRGEIERRVAALGLGGHVLLAGMVANLPALYRSAQLVVMPSSYEPLGMSQIEALSQGVPVIGSRVGGIPETIKDRRTGLLVEPMDAAQWSQALKWALQHPAAMREMAQAGRADVRARFDLAAVLDRFVTHLAAGPAATSA